MEGGVGEGRELRRGSCKVASSTRCEGGRCGYDRFSVKPTKTLKQ